MLKPTSLIRVIIADTFVLCSRNLCFKQRANFSASFKANSTLRTSMLINEFYSLNHVLIAALTLSLMSTGIKVFNPSRYLYQQTGVYFFHTIHLMIRRPR